MAGRFVAGTVLACMRAVSAVVLCACTIALVPGTVVAQAQRAAKNAVVVEALGNGGVYSVNYDRLLTDDIALRAGFGAWSGGDPQYKEALANLTAIVGYRYQRPSGGFMFRLGFTPFISLTGDYPDSGFFPSGGVSLGFSFI